jgi:hypothetical protein
VKPGKSSVLLNNTWELRENSAIKKRNRDKIETTEDLKNLFIVFLVIERAYYKYKSNWLFFEIKNQFDLPTNLK